MKMTIEGEFVPLTEGEKNARADAKKDFPRSNY